MDLFRKTCKDSYGWLESGGPSDRTVFCTIAIIVLTVCLETFVHYNVGCCDCPTQQNNSEAAIATTNASAIPLTTTVSEQPALQTQATAVPQATSDNDASPATDAKPDEGKEEPGKNFWDMSCTENPSSAVRANRLAVAILLFGVVLYTFILRMQEVVPHVPVECRSIIHPAPSNWTAIIIFDILPFTCACSSFLRALVDSVLVRWGKALTYDGERKGSCMWMPCMPLFMVFIVAYIVFEGIKVPIACLMGNRDISIFTAKNQDKGKKRVVADIEMQAEEAQALVDNVDGADETDGDGADGPPAYDEVYSPRASLERKHREDSRA